MKARRSRRDVVGPAARNLVRAQTRLAHAQAALAEQQLRAGSPVFLARRGDHVEVPEGMGQVIVSEDPRPLPWADIDRAELAAHRCFVCQLLLILMGCSLAAIAWRTGV